MSTSTATIRVPVSTRDRFAAQARERRVSISVLVTELAALAEGQAAFGAERAATRAESNVHKALREDGDWNDTVDDGIA